jgi:heme/copper-type cytochrome/quinol oxidase subunit 3
VGIALLAWIVQRQRRWLPARRFLAVDLTAWYLHAMTVLWIYLFAFLMFV